MDLNNSIFEDIRFIKASDASSIFPYINGKPNSQDLTDEQALFYLAQYQLDPMSDDESDAEYQQRVDEFVEANPVLALFNPDGVLATALTGYQEQHSISLPYSDTSDVDIINLADSTINNSYFFFTGGDTDDFISTDLFNDFPNGNLKQDFLDYLETN